MNTEAAPPADHVARTPWSLRWESSGVLRDVVDWVCGYLKDAPDRYVKKGDKVQPSTRIGRIGASGGTSWAHLHHEQRY